MSEVRLISITPGAEKQILYIARVSSDQSNESTGLIKYLIRHKHWSPFEMAHAVFEIITSRAIAAQILRHRSFSFQEFSQRYAMPSDYEQYKARERTKGASNRQSSTDTCHEEEIDWFNETQQKVWDFSKAMYDEAIERQIAKETARFILPLSTTTRLYMAGSIRSWIHYIELRADEHTQEEHRVIAMAVRDKLSGHLPTIKEVLWSDG